MTAESNADSTPEEPEVKPEVNEDDRLNRAKLSVQHNIYWAMGAGVLPLPLFDLVATTGVQLKMLRELCDIYGVPFKEGLAKKAVTSLLVSIGGIGIGSVVGMSFFKFVPVIGSSLGAVSVPVVLGMLTHAVGQTFIMHFESGGTLLDFDAGAMKAYFKQEYGNAKHVVDNMKKNEDSAAQPA